MLRRIFWPLALMTLALPLSGLLAQDPEAEGLAIIQRAFANWSALNTFRSDTDMENTLEILFIFPDGEEIGYRAPIRFQFESAIRQEQGTSVLEAGKIHVESGGVEYIGTGSDESGEDDISLVGQLSTEYALVAEQICMEVTFTEGEIFSELSAALTSASQQAQASLEQQQTLNHLLTEMDIGEALLSLEERPQERQEGQGMRVFQLLLDPEHPLLLPFLRDEYVEEMMVDLPEIRQSLLYEFTISILDSIQLELNVWVGAEDGLLHRTDWLIEITGNLDALDEPGLGFWMKIAMRAVISARMSDHDQLTDDDFVMPCVPSGLDATSAAPLAPRPAGAAPGRSR